MQKDTNKSLVTQMLHLLKKAKTHAERIAIQSDGKEFTYGYLDERSDEIAPLKPTNPAAEATAMMEPTPCSFMMGIACFI